MRHPLIEGEDAVPLVGWKDVCVESEEAVDPSEEPINDIEHVLPDAGQDVFLLQIASIDQHQTELFVALVGCVCPNDFSLPGGDLACLLQDAGQRAVFIAKLSEDEFSAMECHPSGLIRAFDRQRARLAR